MHYEGIVGLRAGESYVNVFTTGDSSRNLQLRDSFRIISLSLELASRRLVVELQAIGAKDSAHFVLDEVLDLVFDQPHPPGPYLDFGAAAHVFDSIDVTDGKGESQWLTFVTSGICFSVNATAVRFRPVEPSRSPA